MISGIPAPLNPDQILQQGFHSINDIINRSRQASMERQKMADMKKIHEADLALRRQGAQQAQSRFEAAQAHQAQFDPLNMQLLKDQISGAHNRNDPGFKAKQIQAMINSFGGGESPQETPYQEAQSAIPGINGEQQSNPSINGNAVSPMEANNQQKKMPFTKEELIRHVMGLPSNTSRSGITTEDRALDRDLKRAQLDEMIAHHRKLEETASTDEKIKLESQRKDLETAAKKLQGENKAEIAWKESLGKEEGKTYAKMEEVASKGIEDSAVYQGMVDTIASPAFKEISAHPLLGKYSLKYYATSGTPDQQKAAADLQIYGNKIIADTAKQISSRATNMDLTLAKAMKISENDSFEGARAKANALVTLQRLGQNRLDKALEISRRKHVSPYEAMKLADKQIDAPAIRESIRKSIYGEKKETPSKWGHLSDEQLKKLAGE